MDPIKDYYFRVWSIKDIWEYKKLKEELIQPVTNITDKKEENNERQKAK